MTKNKHQESVGDALRQAVDVTAFADAMGEVGSRGVVSYLDRDENILIVAVPTDNVPSINANGNLTFAGLGARSMALPGTAGACDAVGDKGEIVKDVAHGDQLLNMSLWASTSATNATRKGARFRPAAVIG